MTAVSDKPCWTSRFRRTILKWRSRFHSSQWNWTPILSLLSTLRLTRCCQANFFEVSFSLVWKKGGVTKLIAWGLGFEVATWGFTELAAWGLGLVTGLHSLRLGRFMDSSLVRGESARLVKQRRASLERKPQLVKAAAGVPELLTELANLKAQTHEFFEIERGLCGEGLNPKLASDMAVLTQEKIEEVWGKCTTYKTTNSALPLERRRELVELYAKIYGKTEVTNYKFMAWVVKGNIAEQMGLKVDWAFAALSTSFTPASRMEGDLV